MRCLRAWGVSICVCALGAAAAGASDADVRPHAGMLRYPDVGQSHIVFVYANDLWTVPREGGLASPLASPPGAEAFPKFSPDGKTIGFTGNYEGNRDLYTISIDGGAATRVTHHPATEVMYEWTADGKLVYYSNGLAGLRRQTQLFTVASGGGLPTRLPVPYGANGTISADGQWLAYTPHTRDGRTWKRYRGGMATDIWLFNLKTHQSKKITDWEGTDSLPMWHGSKVYYLSDGGKEHKLNIWSYDTSSGRRAQVTTFNDYDVKWPSIGPGPAGGGEIVFQKGADIHLLDLGSGESRAVKIAVPGDRPKIRARQIDVKKNITDWSISSSGKRGVFGARGDIWTVPAKNGSPRNLTRTSGVNERFPSWSPDGRWIAFFADTSGEYELYITQSDGNGETRRLTTDGKVFRNNPTWSPDSERIAFTDKAGGMFIHTIESGTTHKFDTEPWSSQPRMSWSHDSNWIAYGKGGDNQQSALWLYNVEKDAKHQVTSGMFSDSQPTFDRKGDYLVYASNREFSSPIYEDVGTTFVYANTSVLLAVPLRADVGSPWAPKSDEEEWKDGDEDESDDEKESDDKDESDGDDEDDDEDDEKDEKKKEEIKPLEIELDGFERRAIPLPVKRGNFRNPAFNSKGKLLYVRVAARGSSDKPSVKIFDFEDEKKEEKTVIDDVGGFDLSADGKKIMIAKDGKYAIVDAKEEQKMDEPMPLASLDVTIDPRAEWRQIFHEAWRVQRDFFYDPNMHGVDWNAVRERYAAMLDDCVSREDVSFLIREMIAEMNVGHAYYFGGDVESSPTVAVGMLGCDYELSEGAYRISKIYEGAAWDSDARGPLSQPGVDVSEGDYLLAVDHVAVDASKDPWAAFVGLADKVVTVTVSKRPAMDDEARDVTVKLLTSESNLRYRAWIERNRKYVEEKTSGQVGYIYVPDTGVNGQNNLFRQFYGQKHMAAMIIDERWNAGGQIPTRFIELLNRPATNYWARRDGRDWMWPPDSHQGPKCMLINGLAGSGGDCFPYYFKQAGVGKVIGMRTWGGLVGMSGNPALIDGGYTSSPSFAFYEIDGTWGVEGHGVDPNIEVIDDPALMVDGGDPQLDAAIEHMLDELRKNPYRAPSRPAYPDRSGMGIIDADK